MLTIRLESTRIVWPLVFEVVSVYVKMKTIPVLVHLKLPATIFIVVFIHTVTQCQRKERSCFRQAQFS